MTFKEFVQIKNLVKYYQLLLNCGDNDSILLTFNMCQIYRCEHQNYYVKNLLRLFNYVFVLDIFRVPED